LIIFVGFGLDDEFLHTRAVWIIVAANDAYDFSLIDERLLAAHHELHSVSGTTVNTVAVT
jgi:hypothetical protein